MSARARRLPLRSGLLVLAFAPSFAVGEPVSPVPSRPEAAAGVDPAPPVSPSAPPDVYSDLGDVVGMAWGLDRIPSSALPLLRRNGFVVVPRFYRRLFSLYQGQVDWKDAQDDGIYHCPDDGVGHYVTADSVLDTYHTILEDQLKMFETACNKWVGEITRDLAAHFHALASKADMAGPDADAAGLAEAYFAVAARLLDVKTAEPARFKAEVEAEVKQILDAGGTADSSLFRYGQFRVDYTQFKPRGFYTDTTTLESFFRAMTWYGLIAFRIDSEAETRAALLIARAFHENPSLRERWQAIDKAYTALLAPCDDLTPVEYAQAWAQTAGGAGSVDRFEAFRKAIAALRDPKINSMVVKDMEWIRHNKGLRLFGKRYIPDSELFMETTSPIVRGRRFPSGLDVLAANGSARARELALRSNPPAPAGYEEGLRRGAAHLERFQREAPDSCYARFLQTLTALTTPPPTEAAPFARTQAYSDKSIMTALASWASMRHTFQLLPKQYDQLGGDEDAPMTGYVEPNPEFFRRMKALVARTRESLSSLSGLSDGKDFQSLASDWSGLEWFVNQLSGMVEKELGGTPFSERENRFLEKYGEQLAVMQGYAANAFMDRLFPWMGQIADVYTEHQVTDRCLQVATGGAMPIYVIVEHAGRRQLMIGGVYSYYEFEQPIPSRMTDEAWRGAWDRGDAPALPPWTASFIAGHEGPPSAFRRIMRKALPYFVPACALVFVWWFLRRRRRPSSGGVAGGGPGAA